MPGDALQRARTDGGRRSDHRRLGCAGPSLRPPRPPPPVPPVGATALTPAATRATATAGPAAAAGSASTGTSGAAATPAGADGLRRLELSQILLEALGHDLALVDPHLHADAAEGGAGLVEAVVDVRAQSVQRHASVGVALGAGHLGSAQPAGHLDLHALGARSHRARERALHRAPEGHAVLELLGDRLRHQARVELGPLDLEDVHLHGLAGHLVELLAQSVHFANRTCRSRCRAGRCGC